MEYVDGVKLQEEPLLTVFNQRYDSLRQPEDGKDETPNEAKLSAICRSLANLSLPIKLIRLSAALELGRFPRYDEEFEFVSLASEVIRDCFAVSHRWTDPLNSRSELDVEWLQNNLDKISWGETSMESVLLFYDFTSLPQEIDGEQRTLDESLTFKAGLELIDFLFAARSLIIPTKGYLFRYWCYVEYFITEYNTSRVSGNPFMDSLPRELYWMDGLISKLADSIKHPETGRINPEYQTQVFVQLASLNFLNKRHRKTLLVHIQQFHSYSESAQIEFYKHIVAFREELADVIRSRLRQCTITEESDKAYLNNLIGRYIDKKFDSVFYVGEFEARQVHGEEATHSEV